ncbi:hypothetical protein TrVFT333_005522 [Trichoderma virens FT-333]|nr:hypothetical protein TrVFT333_005522 [Trichoderma virens FT-333]
MGVLGVLDEVPDTCAVLSWDWWLRDIAQLVSDSAAEERVRGWTWMQPPIRDATGTARNALAEKAPIGHPLSAIS